MRFSERDRAIVNNLHFDAAAEPSFELMKSCLIWPDERPENVSRDGWEILGDLLIVRGFLHKEIPPEKWWIKPARFLEVWEHAKEDVPNWPGFRRLALSRADRQYLEKCIEEEKTSKDI